MALTKARLQSRIGRIVGNAEINLMDVLDRLRRETELDDVEFREALTGWNIDLTAAWDDYTSEAAGEGEAT